MMINQSRRVETSKSGWVEPSKVDLDPQLLAKNLRGASADGEVNVAARLAERSQERDGVGSAAGSRHSQDKSRPWLIVVLHAEGPALGLAAT